MYHPYIEIATALPSDDIQLTNKTMNKRVITSDLDTEVNL